MLKILSLASALLSVATPVFACGYGHVAATLAAPGAPCPTCAAASYQSASVVAAAPIAAAPIVDTYATSFVQTVPVVAPLVNIQAVQRVVYPQTVAVQPVFATPFSTFRAGVGYGGIGINSGVYQNVGLRQRAGLFNRGIRNKQIIKQRSRTVVKVR